MAATVVPDRSASSRLFRKFGAVTGDIVVAGEFWFVPTAWPPLNSRLPQDWAVNAITDFPLTGSSEPQECSGLPDSQRQLQFAQHIRYYSYRDYTSAGVATGFSLSPVYGPWSPRLEGVFSGLASGTKAFHLAAGNGSSDGYLFRTHQAFQIALLKPASWVPLQSSSAASRGPAPQGAGVTRSWYPGSQWAQWLNGSDPELLLNAAWWDGESDVDLCLRNGMAPPFPGASWQSSPAGTASFGGHDSAAPLRFETCASTAEVLPTSSEPNPCIRLPAIGDQAVPQPGEVVKQAGYNTLSLWWKPCPACEGGGGCDTAECARNVTHLLQRRLAKRNSVPAPALLQQLRVADGFAYNWYECSPTSSRGFAQGTPQCVPICGNGDDALAVPWRSVAMQTGTAGELASRSWLMAWTGRRGGQDAATEGCVTAATVVNNALSRGAMADAVHAPRVGRNPVDPALIYRLLLSPWLSEANTTLVLEVPVLQLQRVAQDVFLVELTADIADTVGSTAAVCVTLTCQDCPADTNTSVWSEPFGPAPTADPASASPSVRLVISARFSPRCTHGQTLRDAGQLWLIDARAQAIAATEEALMQSPVAMTGTGSNTSWLSFHPTAAATATAWGATRENSASRSPLVSALTLASAVADGSSARVIGSWLVWARASEQSSPGQNSAQVRIGVLCLDGKMGTAVLETSGTPGRVELAGMQACAPVRIVNAASILSMAAAIIAVAFATRCCCDCDAGSSPCRSNCPAHGTASSRLGLSPVCVSRAVGVLEAARLVCLAAAATALAQTSLALSVTALFLLLVGIGSQIVLVADVVRAARRSTERAAFSAVAELLLLPDSSTKATRPTLSTNDDDGEEHADDSTAPRPRARQRPPNAPASSDPEPATRTMRLGLCWARRAAALAGARILTERQRRSGGAAISVLHLLPALASVPDLLIGMQAETVAHGSLPRFPIRLSALAEQPVTSADSGSALELASAFSPQQRNQPDGSTAGIPTNGPLVIGLVGNAREQPPLQALQPNCRASQGTGESPRPLAAQTELERNEQAAHAKAAAAMRLREAGGGRLATAAASAELPHAEAKRLGLASVDITVDAAAAPRAAGGSWGGAGFAGKGGGGTGSSGAGSMVPHTWGDGDGDSAGADQAGFLSGDGPGSDMVPGSAGQGHFGTAAGMRGKGSLPRCAGPCLGVQSLLVAGSMVLFGLAAVVGQPLGCALLEPWLRPAMGSEKPLPPALACSSWPVVGGSVARAVLLIWVPGLCCSVASASCMMMSETLLRASATYCAPLARPPVR